MADALCGPSNALQNFQKHTTVDRTLQQDRLIGRHTPTQGFRSSPGPNVGALDSEFDAFQSGRPGPPQDFQHFPSQFAPPPLQQHYAQASQAPDWANDFQRLNISTPPPQVLQQQRAQAANAASAWHQDFMTQQAPVAQAPALQQNTYGVMSGYGMGGFAAQPLMPSHGFQNAHVSEVAQGKQPAQEAIPAFDEAAFEQAFAQAQQDMLEEAEAEQKRAQAAQANPEVLGLDRPGEMDPLLVRIRETRPAVYSAIQVWSETGLGRTEEAVSYLENMDRLERSGHLVQDANEAKWIVDSLQRIVNRDAPQEVKTRAEKLITAINQRLMSQYPLGARVPMSEEQIWSELDKAGYMRTPEHERVEQEPEQKEEQPQMNDDDEMAATAGRLLERVADNTSEKFQNSQFLELMRRLRDREVRVQEDKIVEVNDAVPEQTSQVKAAPSSTSYPYTELQPQEQQPQPQAQPASSTQIPDIDPQILDHAATDFDMPIYSDEGHDEQYDPSQVESGPIMTDEISDQFRNYNVNASYHR
ncbi:Nn.00g018260.m01.CDS01 [Neocucurbitaria sp. VM-36]